jgi:hypothetical protein
MAALYNAVCMSLRKGLLCLSNFKPNRRASTNFNVTPNKSNEIASDGCGTLTCGERNERTDMTRLIFAIPFENALKKQIGKK